MLDWQGQRNREQVAQFLAYASAHLVPKVAAAAIGVVVDLRGAFRPRLSIHAPEGHDAVGPSSAPADAPDVQAASQADAATDQAVCMKADSELARLSASRPLAVLGGDKKRIDERIHVDYAPSGALSRFLNIRAGTEVYSPARHTYRFRTRAQQAIWLSVFSRMDRLLRQRLRDLIADLWEYIVNASCHEAERHEIDTGGLKITSVEVLREREERRAQ